MSTLLMDKFGPRLTEIANLLLRFQERLYYVYDSKDIVENFKDSTDHLLNILIGDPSDNEETVFEKLESDIKAVHHYRGIWDEFVENEVYTEVLVIIRRLQEELESLLIAWNTQTDSEKREVLSSVRKTKKSSRWI